MSSTEFPGRESDTNSSGLDGIKTPDYSLYVKHAVGSTACRSSGVGPSGERIRRAIQERRVPSVVLSGPVIILVE